MPKIKKSKKIVSLVAYESGAESETSQADRNTDTEESDDEDQNSQDSNEPDEDLQQTASKRTRNSSDFSGDSQDVICEKELQGNQLTAKSPSSKMEIEENQPSPPVVASDNPIEVNESNSNNGSTANTSRYTLEKGFPPGCENIKLPAAPNAPCSQSLQNKITQVVERMNKFNYNINDDIHRKKSFRNPSIYEKLIDVYGVDEFGSSFPTHIEDLKSNGYLFYDELDNAQRAEWTKKDKEKKERTKIEMVSATKKISK